MLTLFLWSHLEKDLPLGNYMSARSNSQSREINQKQSSEIFALENVCGEVDSPLQSLGSLSPSRH